MTLEHNHKSPTLPLNPSEPNDTKVGVVPSNVPPYQPSVAVLRRQASLLKEQVVGLKMLAFVLAVTVLLLAGMVVLGVGRSVEAQKVVSAALELQAHPAEFADLDTIQLSDHELTLAGRLDDLDADLPHSIGDDLGLDGLTLHSDLRLAASLGRTNHLFDAAALDHLGLAHALSAPSLTHCTA